MKIDEGLVSLIYKTIRTGLKISTSGSYVEFKIIFMNGNEINFRLKKDLFKQLRDILNEVDV